MPISDWDVERRGGRVIARRGSLVAMSLAGLAAVDREAADELIDPDGLQRAFCEVAGMEPRLPQRE